MTSNSFLRVPVYSVQVVIYQCLVWDFYVLGDPIEVSPISCPIRELKQPDRFSIDVLLISTRFKGHSTTATVQDLSWISSFVLLCSETQALLQKHFFFFIHYFVYCHWRTIQGQLVTDEQMNTAWLPRQSHTRTYYSRNIMRCVLVRGSWMHWSHWSCLSVKSKM